MPRSLRTTCHRDYPHPRPSRGSGRVRRPPRGAPMRMPQTTRSARSALGAVAAGALLLAASPTASAGIAAQPPRTPTADTTSNLAAATTYTPSPGDVRMKSALTSRATTARFGTAFSGAVIDAASNATVWGMSSGTYRMPASTNKLVTASNALTVFGPDKRWTTTVRAGSSANRVILVGSGDPSLKSANLDAMARTTAAALLAKKITAARVYVDDDVFPTPSLAYGWKSSYVPDSIAPVRGVVRDQRNNSDTSAEAARYFRDRLLRPRQRRRGLRDDREHHRLDPVVDRRLDAPLQRQRDGRVAAQAGRPRAGLRRVLERRPHRAGPGARGAEAEERHALRRVGPFPGRPPHRPAARPDRRPRHRRPHPGHSLAAQVGVADRGVDRHPGQPVQHHQLEVRRRQGVREDRHAQRRRGPRGLDDGRRRADQDVRVPGQRQDLVDHPEAERRHAGRDGYRVLLSERP